MSTPDLAVQIEHLDQRLAQVEAILRRLEQLLISLEVSPSGESPPTQTRLPQTIRLVSTRGRKSFPPSFLFSAEIAEKLLNRESCLS